MVPKAVADVAGYATSFGYSVTYWDYVHEIAADRSISELIDLSVSSTEIENILRQAGFVGYRLDGALEWCCKAIGMLRAL